MIINYLFATCVRRLIKLVCCHESKKWLRLAIHIKNHFSTQAGKLRFFYFKNQ